jgi:hypothetical protein
MLKSFSTTGFLLKNIDNILKFFRIRFYAMVFFKTLNFFVTASRDDICHKGQGGERVSLC